MSVETWKAEFYPVGARVAAEAGPVDAAEHSRRKWTGFLPRNLKQHGVTFDQMKAGCIMIEQCPDGPRYKALGNSMAVPVMRWILDRLRAVDELTHK
jgi:site-specific DNA-cytosine methylase